MVDSDKILIFGPTHTSASMLLSALVEGKRPDGSRYAGVHEPFHRAFKDRMSSQFHPPAGVPRWERGKGTCHYDWVRRNLSDISAPIALKTSAGHYRHKDALASLLRLTSVWADLIILTSRPILDCACSIIVDREKSKMGDWSAYGRYQGMQPGSSEWKPSWTRHCIRAAEDAIRTSLVREHIIKSGRGSSIRQFSHKMAATPATLANVLRHWELPSDGSSTISPSPLPIMAYLSQDALSKISTTIHKHLKGQGHHYLQPFVEGPAS